MQALLEKIMADEKQAEGFLTAVAQMYLKKLQSGAYGNPTTNSLQNAGQLHSFLANLSSGENNDQDLQ